MAEASAGSLQGKCVVVTRAAEQSQDLVRALQEKGAVPVVLPMVAFSPADNLAELDQAICELAQFDWMFLTSQNALRALEERCQALHSDLPSAIGALRVGVVGPATAEAARAAGISVSYVATKHQGASFAQELAGELRGKRIFLPRSDRANPDLVEQLHRLRAHVTDVVAYKTIAPDESALAQAHATLQQPVDAVLFFSPSAVHHLQDILGNEKVLELSRRAIFAAIGPVTEKALHSADVERVLLAADTTVNSIVEALEGHFARSRSRLSAGVKQG